MRRIEIYVNYQPAAKEDAARQLSDPDNQGYADICLLGADGRIEHKVQVWPRHRAFGKIQDAGVNWSSIGSVSAAEARQYGELIVLAAETAEMANAMAVANPSPSAL